MYNYLILLCLIVAVNGLQLPIKVTGEAGHYNSQLRSALDEPDVRNGTGIVIGTEHGLILISSGSSEQTQLSSCEVGGVAFDWKSAKVYWAHRGVGIMRSNVDGSGFQMLLLDQDVFGMALDEITGNLYYASRSKQAIRVCNNDVNKCSTIIRSSDFSYVDDVALHAARGFLFWSIRQSASIFRANTDGTNMALILQRPAVRGLGVDERNERLYWADGVTKEIGSCGLNGEEISVLMNTGTYVNDVEIDGDNVYFTNWAQQSVYVTTKQRANPSLVANFANRARHIALFGRKISRSGPNPCEFNECDHLCVVTSASSYRCLCADGEELKDDGLACKR